MPEQAAQNLRDCEQRIDLQIIKIAKLELAGRLSDARCARETLAAITETRDALRLRLKVASEVATAAEKWASLMRSISPSVKARNTAGPPAWCFSGATVPRPGGA